jgi:hypothetical protein
MPVFNAWGRNSLGVTAGCGEAAASLTLVAAHFQQVEATQTELIT